MQALNRKHVLSVGKGGDVYISLNGAKAIGLPVYSVDTEEQANAIRVLLCRLGYNGSYILTHWTGNVDDLALVAQQMEHAADAMRSGRMDPVRRSRLINAIREISAILDAKTTGAVS